MQQSNIRWHPHSVNREDREALNQHRGAVIWFTGLSGSGKSTLAGEIEQVLHQKGIRTYLLDGDNVRHGLCNDLGFSDQDRQENIRRVGEVAALMADAGLVVLSAFISPHRTERALVRSLLPTGRFVEVFVDTPLAVCEQRDPKGLYRKARAGEIHHFTGIDSEYQRPEAPEIRLDGEQAMTENVAIVLRQLTQQGIIND